MGGTVVVRSLETAAFDFVKRRRREVAAGGYSRDDGTVEFFQRVCAVLPDGAEVLDLGAGRGAWYRRDDTSYRQQLLRLGGRARRRVGVDVDPVVRENPALDEALVLDAARPVLPFDDKRFDLVLSDWVAEHIADPVGFVAEAHRVLKPGGWFCARTPNRWAYFALASRLLSAKSEIGVLAKVQPGRAERDVFPKYYRMNTMGALDRLFGDGWLNASYTHNPMPSYHGGVPGLFSLIEAYQKLTPQRLATVLLIFAQRLG